MAVLLLAAVPACGAERGATVTADPDPSASVDHVDSAHEVLEGFVAFSYDYTPIASKNELGDLAELVVVGNIGDVLPGRTLNQGKPYAAPRAAVEVTVTHVAKGEAAAVGDDVWFELPTAPDILRRGLTPGLEVAVYLIPAQPGSAAEPYSTQGSQVPEDASLWSVVHPQGLVVQYDEEAGTVSPMTEKVRPAATVEDALPPGGT